MGLGPHQESAPKSRYRLIRFVLVAAALGWLGGEIYIRWAEMTSLSLDGRWFSISIVAFAVALLAQVVAWRWNLVCLGADISYPSLFRLYYTMNLARYIPGKIWSLAGMVAGGTRLGIDGATMFASVFLGLVSSLVSGLCVGVLAAWLMGHLNNVSLLLAGVPVLALAALWPPVFRRWSGWLLRRVRPGSVPPVVSGALLFRSVLHYGLVWCGYAVAVGALALALGASEFGLYFAAFPLAYLAGYAALLAPGGWGVREGALIVLAGGGAIAVAVALWQRLILTVFELGLFAYSVWSWRHD